MTDTMTNREAIDILRVISPPRESKRIFDKFMQARDMAIKALEKLAAIKSRTSPSDDWEYYADRLYDIAYQNGCEQGKKCAEQDRWIPVTERPPEEDKGLLVTDEYGEIRHAVYIDWHGKVEFRTIEESITLDNVKAWRPLPEPYTEDEA